MTRITPALLCLLLSISPIAGAEELIKEFKGGRSTNTLEFDVRAPWIMDWRVTGDLSEEVAVDVALINANTGAFEGTALKTKAAGNGVRLFDQSGRFYFRVDALFMNWTLKVIQLTEEEAKLYTPKSNHPLDQ